MTATARRRRAPASLEHTAPATFVVRDADGDMVCMLSYRSILALVAIRAGLARMVERGCYTPYYSFAYLDPQCDVFGIGHHTITELQRDDDWGAGLATKPVKPGPVKLTRQGEKVFELLAAQPGFSMPEFVVSEARG